MPNHRLLAFHLPQFHPVPDNDTWWGKGFTEWRNVTRAKPQFPGHYQPHLPADLGFYDLRLPEARQAQADLAREYGIHGFVYYHYWFNGRRILERPVNEILRLGEPDFPFCLCWANENWSRRWDGSEAEILLGQNYSAKDDLDHIAWLITAFRDRRYIKVHGKPLLLVYKLSHLPDPAATVARWRRAVEAAGFPGLYLCNVEADLDQHGLVPRHGLDAAVEFAPDLKNIPRQRVNPWLDWMPRRIMRLRTGVYARHRIFEYSEVAERMLAKPAVDYLRFPGVTPSWDNCARRKEHAIILRNATPERYGEWLSETLRRFNPPNPEENFVFINAWNEWAEGNHLEPCQKWGRKYLEATSEAIGLGSVDHRTLG